MKNLKILTALCLALATPLAMAGVNNYSDTTALYSMIIFASILQLPVLITIIFMNNVVKPYQDLPHGKEYAGCWRRLTAATIDMVGLILVFLLLEIIWDSINPIGQYSFYFNLALPFIRIIIYWLYFAFFQSSKYQATPGMMVMKFKIHNEALGKIGFWRSSGRYWSVLPGALSFLMVAFTKRKQGIHDMIARTVCVKN